MPIRKRGLLACPRSAAVSNEFAAGRERVAEDSTSEIALLRAARSPLSSRAASAKGSRDAIGRTVACSSACLLARGWVTWSPSSSQLLQRSHGRSHTADANRARAAASRAQTSMDPVKLIASDGTEIIIDKRAAMVSGTIKSMLSGPGASRAIIPPGWRTGAIFSGGNLAATAVAFLFPFFLRCCREMLVKLLPRLETLTPPLSLRVQANSRRDKRARSSSQRSRARSSRLSCGTFITSSSTPTTRARCPSSRSRRSSRSSCSWRPTSSTRNCGGHCVRSVRAEERGAAPLECVWPLSALSECWHLSWRVSST